MILLKVTAIKAKEAATAPTRTITTAATTKATIVAIYVSSFVLPLSRSLICLIAKLVQFGIIHADSPTSRRTAQLSSAQLSLARISQGLIEATTIHKDSHVD